MNTVDEIKADIWQQAYVGREHILAFLRLQDTSDSMTLRERTENLLTELHNDPYYSKVLFPVEQLTNFQGQGNAINRILDDLEGYGRLLHETIVDAPPPEIEKPELVSE